MTTDVALAPKTRPLGLFAICTAIVLLSAGSSLAKKSGITGPTMAFYRMLIQTFVWSAIRWKTEHTRVSTTDLRRAFVPGIAFGLNLACFFLAATTTSIANAEFIAALAPLVVVPLAARMFHEHINPRALLFGLVSVAGLILVLFHGPSKGVSSRSGDLVAVAAMFVWSAYLLSSRRLRADMSVAAIMSAVMPLATIAVLPIVVARGELFAVTWHSVPYILGLVVLNGTIAHGLILFSQKTVNVGTIGILQVGQPALAVVWAFVLLGQDLRPIQVLGMVLVLAGLAAVVGLSRRTARRFPIAARR